MLALLNECTPDVAGLQPARGEPIYPHSNVWDEWPRFAALHVRVCTALCPHNIESSQRECTESSQRECIRNEGTTYRLPEEGISLKAALLNKLSRQCFGFMLAVIHEAQGLLVAIDQTDGLTIAARRRWAYAISDKRSITPMDKGHGCSESWGRHTFLAKET